MKSPMRTAFEQWFGFEVSDDMDIQTSVAWDNWRIAWAAATTNAARCAEEHAKNKAYTPAQKRALDSWLRRAVLASGIESSNDEITGCEAVRCDEWLDKGDLND